MTRDGHSLPGCEMRIGFLHLVLQTIPEQFDFTRQIHARRAGQFLEFDDLLLEILYRSLESKTGSQADTLVCFSNSFFWHKEADYPLFFPIPAREFRVQRIATPPATRREDSSGKKVKR